MGRLLLRLFVSFGLFFNLFAGTIFHCFSKIQRASAVGLILVENESGNNRGDDKGNNSENSSISLIETGKQAAISSEEPFNPAHEKLSVDLLQFCDERCLSGDEFSRSLRARMVKLGQLSQTDPALKRASGSAETPAGSEKNTSESPFSSGEKVLCVHLPGTSHKQQHT